MFLFSARKPKVPDQSDDNNNKSVIGDKVVENKPVEAIEVINESMIENKKVDKIINILEEINVKMKSIQKDIKSEFDSTRKKNEQINDKNNNDEFEIKLSEANKNIFIKAISSSN